MTAGRRGATNTHMNNKQVTLLLAKSGRVVSVHENQVDAEAKRDQYNADPFLDAETPDEDAPYRAETWSVTASGEP